MRTYQEQTSDNPKGYNGRKSGGPKSAAGKRRVGRNARRHGLTVTVLADEVLAHKLKDLARLDRYERLALWRRKIAARAFDAATIERAKQT